MALNFGNLYNGAAVQAGSENELQRARDATVYAIRELTYGIQLPKLLPWWRKREDSITAMAATQSYNLPTAQGTIETLHKIWYRMSGVRFQIEIVDDDTWQDEVNENTANTGTPQIANLHQSTGTVQLRFDPMPSTSFVSQVDGSLIRLDAFIEDPLAANLITDTSQDSTQPLMPDSRRPGIIWKATEIMAARQGDRLLIEWAFAQGKRYYEAILADDIGRTGDKQRVIRPLEPVGDFGQSVTRLPDYGHSRR